MENCIKTTKFLFWTTKKVVHDYKINYITKFMNSSDDFHVQYKCSVCGAEKLERFVETDELIMMGINPLELNKITTTKPYYPENY